MAQVIVNFTNVHKFTRVTRGGRTLSYEMGVIQQPERARACGSGAKSSADRRPVDPPPVVILKIFEVDGANKTDITFSYNAHFFCFATLEHAPRTLVNGRPHNVSPQQQPVLTGMPVSGMAYLDRPEEAGYFIFPDLSVRHEGLYTLEFTLYEQTKDEKDFDPEVTTEADESDPQMPAGSFDYRMNVKSSPFTVFSAKKFPGLAESTMLSRTVAEQGSRVRIRRDVRMRRRDGKAEGYDEFDEGTYAARARSTTPSNEYNRQRSVSNTGNDRQRFDQRRPSNAYDSSQTYPANFNAPPSNQQSSSGMLGYGAQSSTQTHFPTPQFAQPTSTASQQFPSATPSYQQPSQFRPQQAQDYSYQERQSFGSGDFRRPSSNFSSSLPPKLEPDTRPAYQPYSRQGPPKLAPIQAPVPPVKYEAMPLSASNRTTSVASPTYQERPNYNSFSAPSAPEQRPNNKRSFDSVFPNATYGQPRHNGMRPTSSNGPKSNMGSLDVDFDEAYNVNYKHYKRADGTSYNRELPSLS